MLQRTPVAIRADVATRHPAILTYRRTGVEGYDAPPLDPNGIAILNQDRRRVSLRWLIGSVLTALSGAALIGGAIIISLQGEIVQVQRPQRAVTGTDSGSQASVRKSDRLVRRELAGSAARQTFKAPMSLRAGNREVIKTRDFVRVSAPLSLTAGTYARAIPPFNPLNLFADSDNAAANARDSIPDVTDADVSVVKHELAGMTFSPDETALNDEEARMQVIAEERSTRGFGGRTPLPDAARNMLFQSLRQNQAISSSVPMAYANLTEMPFGDIDVRVIPENVTLLPKQTPQTTQQGEEGDQFVALEEHVVGRAGDLVLKLIVDEGTSPGVARAILNALQLYDHDKLKDGQSLAILPTIVSADTGNAGANHPEKQVIGRVILRENETIQAIAAITDDGRYVPVFLPQEELMSTSAHDDTNQLEPENGPGTQLYESLHETAARYEVPIEIVRELIPLFASDVDLQRRVASGESLELLYTNVEDNGTPELLYAALTVEGETKRLYRFQAPTNGEISFYDPDGRSLQKFLIRKPITEGRLTSSFGMRYHPIMRYAKMHTGIDWANRVGTPILAAGDGVLAKAGWHAGYGKRVEIQHANGYVSTYSHMSNFARGIKAGDRVKQGQVIGYLGSTGLSTGPHLHYEVMVNGRFVDPMKIKLPRSNELDGADLAEFGHQRDQVKDLLVKAQMPG
ncbi:M23 family metallopeptidase [Pseudochelatococcus sp. G4_1912]|uniref:M23 family metallopeptidase n=1 Tax=Pseudochelatococcus sp. G4_1912 TaxID=3114288 RepID=UPI0039C71D5E